MPPTLGHVGIIGGGIVGLATARALATRDDAPQVTVLEKEPRVGAHQTTRNSGVLHAGIYYVPGSRKALLCRRGAELMAAYCQDRGLPYERCGKLIIALRPDELPRMDDLLERGRANGVPGLRRIGPEEITEREPAARGIAALHSPDTAVVDFHAVAKSFAEDVTAADGVIRTGAEVTAIDVRSDRVEVVAAGESYRFDHLIVCGGGQSDRLARLTGAPAGPRVVPFKGGYLRLRPERQGLVRSLIYPVPDPRLPFLGVHLTRRVDGEVLIGPNAFLSFGREAAAPLRTRLADLSATMTWPGFWRFLPSHLRTGATEAANSLSRRRYTREAQRYVPELSLDDTLPGPYGIRAQAVHADGRLEDDFLVTAQDRVLHVRNAPSPAATSSLAIGELLAATVPSRPGDPLDPLGR